MKPLEKLLIVDRADLSADEIKEFNQAADRGFETLKLFSKQLVEAGIMGIELTDHLSFTTIAFKDYCERVETGQQEDNNILDIEHIRQVMEDGGDDGNGEEGNSGDSGPLQ